jgi:diaminohydroxyphosphoribosylaminopyrimidine deaminase/5-amino-6-(5-phosphoribosylamino)uracil reductase
MPRDEMYMRMAMGLAKLAEGKTSPNPIVGALVVKNGRVVGRGYHKKAGLPHAEVNALRAVGGRAKGATLYVTLEPCDHFGRTPPCTDAILRSGVRRVVIGMVDPNPVNNGRGIRKLRRNGVRTTVGVLEEDAVAMNEPYIKFITKKMPYVTVKLAQSLDGKIATRTGDSKWITSEDSRRYVRGLRRRVDAVMIGVNTLIKDDPALLSGAENGREPSRIIVDSHLKSPLTSRIFSTVSVSAVIIATAKGGRNIKRYETEGAEVLVAGSKGGKVDLKRLLKILAGRGMTHILVEGGGELVSGLLKDGLVDRFLFFVAPKIIGGRQAATGVGGEGVARITKALTLKRFTVKRFKNDVLLEAFKR